MKKTVFIILVTFFYQLLTLAIAFADELIIIQSVSNSGKSFIINHGRKDDLFIGQQRAFSTDKISIICQVTELGPYYSLWEVSDKKATVPFRKDQTVLIHTALRDITSQVIYEERKKKNNIDLLPASLKKDMGTRYVSRPNYIVRASISRALSDSSSGQSSQIHTTKQGYHIEALYTHKLFITQFDWALGLRFDKESEEIKEYDMVSPIQRQMIVAEISYHFEPFTRTLNNIFLTLGVGLGKTKSSIDSMDKEGVAYSLPYFKLGFLNPISDSTYLVVDGTLESLSTKETFIDAVDQNTTSLNGKITLGLRFSIL